MPFQLGRAAPRRAHFDERIEKMRRTFKTMGTAAIVTLLLGAIAATAAQASKQAEFTAEKYDSVFTLYPHSGVVEWEDYFEFTPGSKLECHVETHEAKLEAASTKLTVTPHFGDCTLTGGFIETRIDLNGCHAVLEAGTTVGEEVQGSVQIVCPPNKQIEVTSGPCKVDVPAQTVTGALTFTNLPVHGATNATYITIHVDVKDKMHYIDTDGFLCPFQGTETRTDGDWVSTLVVKGYQYGGSTNAHGTTEGALEFTHKEQEINIDVKPK